MMKKLLSLALTLAMLSCMATTAFAATTKTSVVGAVTTDNVTGTPQHEAGSLNNGVNDFSSANSNYQISIDVTSNTTLDRYAVDIVYDTAALEISGTTMTWNVNTMKYDITSGGTDSGNLTKTVDIINYSNKDVKAYAEVVKETDYSDAPVSITSNYISTGMLTVPAATPGVDSNGTPGTGTVTITLDPDTTWGDVTTYLTSKGAGTTVTLATATLYITK